LRDSTKKTNAQIIIIVLGLVPTMTFVRFLDTPSSSAEENIPFDIVIAWTEKKELAGDMAQ
jgi:hypothetical protein